MLKTLSRTLFVAGALAAASLGLGAAPAKAADARLSIVVAQEEGGVILAQQRYERGERQERRGHDEQRFDRRGSCAPGQALRKASRFGLRRAEIVRDNRRAVVVDGWKRGRLVSVRFAQERGCPVLGLR